MAAEHKVLSFIPYLQQPPTQGQTGKTADTKAPSNPAAAAQDSDDISRTASKSAEGSTSDPYGPRRWHSSLIKLAGKNRALNEFSIERVGEEVEQNLVIVHGYGAGLGFFYKNFEPLSRKQGWRLYALDLLGMGRSSRPNFQIHAKDKAGKIAETESFFVDSLEEWRKEKNIDRFTLMGHSLGGYMAVCYALKYPGRLNKLILASPVGIPEDPYAVEEDMPEPGTSTMPEEFAQDQEGATKDNNNFLNRRSKAEAAPSESDKPKRRTLPKWLTYLWDANVSPFSLVRWSGPFGPRLVSGWTSRRFSALPPEEAQALHDYAYSLFRQRGSGEYALAYVLAPGAFARSPLIRRIGDVGRGLLPPVDAKALAESSEKTSTESVRHRERGIPITFMYGENDWMDVAGGFAAEEKLKEVRAKAVASMTQEEASRDEGSSKVLIVPKAGHHVYLDGWEAFNKMIEKEMQEVEDASYRRRLRGERNEIGLER